jgi:hypothetical protein
VDLREAVKPVGIGRDAEVRGRVEVAVTALFVAAEDDDGGRAGREIMKQSLGAGEMVGAGAEVAAEEGGGPGGCVGWGAWLGHGVAGFSVAIVL